MQRDSIDAPQRRSLVIALLAAELKLHERHLALLRRQKAALVAVDRDWFLSLHSEHEALLEELERQAGQRAQLLTDDGGVLLEAEMAQWPESDARRCTEMVDRLRVVSTELRTQSVQNRKLIENEQQFIDFELDLIMNAVRRGAHYASSGSSKPADLNRIFNIVA